MGNLEVGYGCAGENEQDYRSIVESIQDAFYRVDGDGRILLASPSAARLMGYSRVEDLLGRPAIDFWGNPESRQRMLAELERQGELREWGTDLRRADDSLVSVAVTIHRLFDAAGRPKGYEGIIRDITERKRGEERLQQSERKFATIFQMVPDMLALARFEDGAIIDVNPAAMAATGWTREEVIGRNPLEIGFFDDPADRERFRAMLQTSGEVPAQHFVFRRKEGTRRHGVYSARRISLGGEPHVIVSMQDVTLAKGVEEELERRAGELAALNELAKEVSAHLTVDATVATALAHVRETVAPDFAALFLSEEERLVLKGHVGTGAGWPGDQASVHRIGECLCGLAVREGLPIFSADIHTDPRCTFEECKQAGLRAFAALPLLGGGETVGVLGIGSTSARRFEDQASFLEAVAGTIAVGLRNAVLYERTRASAEELQVRLTQIRESEEERAALLRQLQQAQKMEAIGTLAGGIAHDFNNILTPIIAGAELLQTHIPPAHPAQPSLEYILQAGLRAKDLVQQILTFSRQGDDARLPLRVIPVAKEAIRLIRASVPSTIEIRQSITATSDTIRANPSHVHQILMNLCTNAAHAMRETGGRLEIGIANATAETDAAASLALIPGAYLVLTVADTGHGMPPDILDRIFEPFFTTKEQGVGTGMGLAVVHGIVKSCGGTVTVESKAGSGTVFRVWLPSAMETASEQIPQQEPTAQGAGRILIVDDEPMVVRMYGEMLRAMGYEVETATDSLQALDRFRAEPGRYDLVITDQTMPKLTGVELTQEMLRLRLDLPVVLCTGFSETLTKETATRLGVRELLMKPVLRQQLAQVVHAAMGPCDAERSPALFANAARE